MEVTKAHELAEHKIKCDAIRKEARRNLLHSPYYNKKSLQDCFLPFFHANVISWLRGVINVINALFTRAVQFTRFIDKQEQLCGFLMIENLTTLSSDRFAFAQNRSESSTSRAFL